MILMTTALLVGGGDRAGAPSLTWTANREPDLAGYRLYWGPARAQYTNLMTLPAAAVRCEIETRGEQHFALTAFNTAGLESGFTPELVWNPARVVLERSVDGVWWEGAATNEVAPLKPVEWFRVRIERSP
jgi:hypothetical protein